eukprot:1476887-Rhodomonas_salina.1
MEVMIPFMEAMLSCMRHSAGAGQRRTGIAYGAMRCVCCYTTCSTDVAYAATPIGPNWTGVSARGRSAVLQCRDRTQQRHGTAPIPAIRLPLLLVFLLLLPPPIFVFPATCLRLLLSSQLSPYAV